MTQPEPSRSILRGRGAAPVRHAIGTTNNPRNYCPLWLETVTPGNAGLSGQSTSAGMRPDDKTANPQDSGSAELRLRSLTAPWGPGWVSPLNPAPRWRIR